MDPNDHREIGRRLDLFHFQEEAPGMVFWHPRGFELMRVLEEVVRRRIRADGFQEVRSPQLLRRAIWESSGHWQSFSSDMFLVGEAEGQSAAIKPVSCPGHLELAKRMSLSYRDLPLRIAELGLVHRNELSGVLFGLFRLRQFVQDDGHILLEEHQVDDEVRRFCESLQKVVSAFGLGQPEVALSLRPDVRAGDDALWDRAEARLAEAADRAGLQYDRAPGQGAFYGPKLEFALRDHQGRPWQCGTIQLDLILPERFGVFHADSSGARRYPMLLHRALLGSLERFLGILLERSAGRLAPWLAPEQVLVLPVEGKHERYAREVLAALVASGLRAKLVPRPDSLARRVRGGHDLAIPFVAVVGDREASSRSVSVRQPGGASRDLELEQAPRAIADACVPPL